MEDSFKICKHYFVFLLHTYMYIYDKENPYSMYVLDYIFGSTLLAPLISIVSFSTASYIRVGLNETESIYLVFIECHI